ncbi:hypothetical protein B0H13DRAFT_2015688, partial [Mycena leptocephala]
MMSVEGLQSHIAKLSADIELQKEVLKQLERSKVLLRSSSTLSGIQWHGFPSKYRRKSFSPPRPSAHTAPMLLLNVCHAWTHIALSTSILWAAIHLDSPGIQISEIWLQRARNYPLSISLHGSLRFHSTILPQYAQ